MSVCYFTIVFNGVQIQIKYIFTNTIQIELKIQLFFSRELRGISGPLAFRRPQLQKIFRTTNLKERNIRETTGAKAQIKKALKIW